MNEQNLPPAQTPEAVQQPVRPSEETEEVAFVYPQDHASEIKPPASVKKTPPELPAPPIVRTDKSFVADLEGTPAPDAASLLAGLDLFSEDYDDEESFQFPPAVPDAPAPAKPAATARTAHPTHQRSAKRPPKTEQKPSAQSLYSEGRVLQSLEENLADLMDMDYEFEPDEILAQRREFEASMYRAPSASSQALAPDPMRPDIPFAQERGGLSMGSVGDISAPPPPRMALPAEPTYARRVAFDTPQREASMRKPDYDRNTLRRVAPDREPDYDINAPRRETSAREPGYDINAPRREAPAREPDYDRNVLRRETPEREPSYDRNALRREPPVREPGYDRNALRRETQVWEPGYDINAPRRETPAREPDYDMNASRGEAPANTSRFAAVPKKEPTVGLRDDLRFAPEPSAPWTERRDMDMRVLQDRDVRRNASANRWMTARNRRRENTLAIDDADNRPTRETGWDSGRLSLDGQERKKQWKL